jgi:hypothetical protein
METGVANIGGGIKVASNSFNLSLSLKFSSSISIMETSNASSVTLWIQDNSDGCISLRSIMEQYFPFLFFEVLSKINFLEDLSNNALCTKKFSSYEKTSSWMESLLEICMFSCIIRKTYILDINI